VFLASVDVDDVDGGDAAETVSFGLDGTFYELDLSKQNAANLRKSISGFVEHARRVGIPGDDSLPIVNTVVIRPDPDNG